MFVHNIPLPPSQVKIYISTQPPPPFLHLITSNLN